MWYMPMHIAELIACIIFLCMKIFVCFIKRASLLAIVSESLVELRAAKMKERM
jgi:hypothetical protein